VLKYFLLILFLAQRSIDPQKTKAMNDIKTMSDQVRQTAYDIHVYHAQGILEKVYEMLANRLANSGWTLSTKSDQSIRRGWHAPRRILRRSARYDQLIVDSKTAKTLAPNTRHILGYLKSARLSHGLLINFGSYKFQILNSLIPQPSGLGNLTASTRCSLRSLRSLRLK